MIDVRAYGSGKDDIIMDKAYENNKHVKFDSDAWDELLDIYRLPE